ncbi:MAG: response regulator transcription factor [gamma proteobacterium symbiont of Bathyaustriella thionipta]|nr:response regulator transcription factor [gamma proteobacterium symbiont of Bathyaustriella thionipta]MCU7949717.1 response regulator transcription factor [gamma proteobacterium symbiont of Bathyaustriella thionipta]MCU7952919.1 response regulator transcription factor [gamma proteobacterium symbiont of Bathyaustriella thionipta]MCU7956421.1 response regulator transcription factor [gamma proteobacterium symbiont of Bathyaustriella thionipta]MCU7967536.1 response regulator transcription factor 
MRLLLVEDDKVLADALIKELLQHGFAVDHTDNGIDAEFMGDEEPYDIIVLDLGLPQRSGMEVLANWRHKGNRTPVIILTARDAWHERVDGFKAGADDYLGKPFHMDELIVRINALVRRSHDMSGADLETDDIKLNEEQQQLILASGEIIDLTGTEFRLLRYFMLHQDQVLSKTRLTEHIYEQDFDKDSNLIEVYVRRLRDKLGKKRIQTKRGQGYIFLTDAKVTKE